jgi:alanyl-tRNA synthetase
VLLDETPFYPEGGGQPFDLGTLGDARVLAVQRIAGEVRHYVEGTPPRGSVRAEVDWPRRYDHMQQHTAQHLVTAIAADRFGWQTRAFHLGSKLSDIEFDAPDLAREELDALEQAANEEIRKGRRVRSRRVTPEEMDALEVRTRGLPETHSGEVRLVEIDELDLNTCGGTHVASLAELGLVKLLHTEAMRGGTRVYYVAGERARGRLAEQEERVAQLRSLLGAADEELASVVELKLGQLKEALRRAERAEEALADSVAKRLATSGDEIVAEHFPFADARFLQRIARSLSASPSRSLAILTAGESSEGPFVLCAGTRFRGRVDELGRLAAQILEGRGGGRGPIFQGKARAIGLLGAARASLLDALE